VTGATEKFLCHEGSTGYA